jgi:hypothetical protein
VQFRFAHSEAEYLVRLHKKVLTDFEDVLPCSQLEGWHLPHGNLNSPCILGALLDCLEFEGPASQLASLGHSAETHQWILDYPRTPLPSCLRSIQSATLVMFSISEKSPDLVASLITKLCVTLGRGDHDVLFVDTNWFEKLCQLFQHAPIFLRVCWLKAFIGGWCTSSRLHTGANWDCIFGCNARDEFRHYIECPVLWQFAREHLKVKEYYVGHVNDAEERLCTVQASYDKLKLLAFVHILYHSLINDPYISDAANCLRHPAFVQARAEDVCKSILHYFEGTYVATPSTLMIESTEDINVHPSVGEPLA